MSQKEVIVKVMGTPYPVACPSDRINDLETAANYLETRLSETLGATRVSDKNRVLVMLSLNLCDELLNSGKAVRKADEQLLLRQLNKKIDDCIGEKNNAMPRKSA